MRRTRLLLCAAALAATLAVHAQDRLSVDIELGLDGVYAGQRWNRATFVVNNPGPRIRGHLVAEVRGYRCGAQSGSPDASYSIPRQFPRGESRVQTALLMPSYGGSITVKLTTAEGPIFEDTWNVSDLASSASACMVAVTERDDTTWLEEGPRDVTIFTPDRVPTDARTWDAVNYVLLDDVRLGDIPPAARRAMLRRVTTGGMMVLTAPFLSRNGGTAALREFTAVKAEGGAQAVEPAIDVAPIFMPRSDVTARAGRLVGCDVPPADTVAAAQGRPVVFEHSLGAGRVRGLTVDPDWMEFAGTREELSFRGGFWAAALDGQSFSPYQTSDVPVSLVPDESNLTNLRLPLLVYLGLFIVVMGPLNFLLIIRLHRREWMVITAPIAATVFLIAALIMGASLHTDEPLWVQQSATVASAGTPTRGSMLFEGLFAPVTRSYDIELPARDVPVREFQEDRYARYEGHHLPPLRFSPTATTITDMRVKRWAMRAISHPAATTGGTVAARLQIDGSTLTARMRNDLPFALSDCALVHKWNNTSVGSIEPGQSVEVELPLEPPELSKSEMSKVDTLTGPRAWLSRELWDADGDDRRWDLVHSVAGELLYGCAEPILIGWGPPPAPGASVQSAAGSAHGQHLYVVRLPLAAGGPAIEVPVGGAMTSRTGAWSRWVLNRWQGEERPSSSEDRRAVTVEMLLPLEGEAEHEALSIHGKFSDEPGEGYLPEQRLSVYDWRQHTWTVVADSLTEQFEVNVPDPDAAISAPRGIVRVRLQSVDDSGYAGWYALQWIDLSYRGEYRSP